MPVLLAALIAKAKLDKYQAIIKAEQEKQAILKAEQEKQAEREMGIDLCANANTKQMIKEYLAEVGVGNIQSLSRDQADTLRGKVKPKCHKGHTINSWYSYGTYKCDSGRAGDRCFKQQNYMICCADQGCGGATHSNYFFFCSACAYSGE